MAVVSLRSCPRPRCARATCPREKKVSLRQVATCCGQKTCDIRNYAARSLPTGPSLRHGPPLLAFDAAHRDRTPARRSLVPHLRAFAPYSCHCSQHLDRRKCPHGGFWGPPRGGISCDQPCCKPLTLRFAKGSLSNRSLFECLGKNYPRSLRFQAPDRPSELFARTGLLTCSVTDETVGLREPLSGPLFLTTHLAYFTTYIVMFLPAAVLPKGCTGLVVRS